MLPVALARNSVGTTRASAAPAKNTKNATAPTPEISLATFRWRSRFSSVVCSSKIQQIRHFDSSCSRFHRVQRSGEIRFFLML
jgi:hypothetical protein